MNSGGEFMTNTSIVLVLAAALAACQSPQSRIKRNQAAFDVFPPEVQQAIREGRAEAGFTPEQVQMALGKPDRVYTQKTAELTREIWAYGIQGGPRVGVGLGMSSMHLRNGSGSAYGSSLDVASDIPDGRTWLRYVFENGKVVSVERREK